MRRAVVEGKKVEEDEEARGVGIASYCSVSRRGDFSSRAQSFTAVRECCVCVYIDTDTVTPREPCLIGRS